jgi:hypothetical protein
MRWTRRLKWGFAFGLPALGAALRDQLSTPIRPLTPLIRDIRRSKENHKGWSSRCVDAKMGA